MKQQVRLIIWFAMLMSCAMMLGVLYAVPAAPEENRVVGQALLAAGAATVPVSLLLARLASGPGMWIAAMAMCEGAAVLGVVSHAIAGSPQAWLLPVLGLIGTGLHFPRRDEAV
jgi:hypothetical protein